MKITDEMIEAFGNAWTEAHEFEEALSNDRWFVPSGYKRKQGLVAVYPLIAAQVLREAATSIRQEWTPELASEIAHSLELRASRLEEAK